MFSYKHNSQMLSVYLNGISPVLRHCPMDRNPTEFFAPSSEGIAPSGSCELYQQVFESLCTQLRNHNLEVRSPENPEHYAQTLTDYIVKKHGVRWPIVLLTFVSAEPTLCTVRISLLYSLEDTLDAYDFTGSEKDIVDVIDCVLCPEKQNTNVSQLAKDKIADIRISHPAQEEVREEEVGLYSSNDSYDQYESEPSQQPNQQYVTEPNGPTMPEAQPHGNNLNKLISLHSRLMVLETCIRTTV